MKLLFLSRDNKMQQINTRGKTAIVGVGTAGCGEAPGMSELELLGLATQMQPLRIAV